MTLPERFWSRVSKSDDCWEWTGGRGGEGYGYIDGQRAHRVSWELHNGTIPTGLNVLHRCDNPPCVRPDHLFLGTQADNIADKVAKGRQTNLRGEKHPMSKLTVEKVTNIRRFRAMGRPVSAIATAYGISGRHVRDIIAGKYWRV